MALAQFLKSRLEQKSMLLMTHAVTGYPSLDDNWRMLEAMQSAGVDLVELQMPFSEPIADGPAFIRANQNALEAGLAPERYFEFMQRAADTFDFKLLFMGYYNTVFRMGPVEFCRRLREAGGEGFIIADLPPEESVALDREAQALGLDPIRLVTPLNSHERLGTIAAHASGFIYCVARKGVTGRHTDMDTEIRGYLQRCREVTSLPLGIGFGIRSADDVSALKGAADIAIVGTACLEAWERDPGEAYAAFLRSLVEAAR